VAIVDFHNHVMPGVDDGAQTADETVEALTAFQNDGVTVVVATPHVDGSSTLQAAEIAGRLRELDGAFERLEACAAQVGNMRVERGIELLLDVPEPDLTDARLRLAGGRFVLMEFPFMTVPPESGRALGAIVKSGVIPIIAHPERYHGFAGNTDMAADWKDSGALLQVNGGSLLGRYGPGARAAAFELLQRGWVDYLCSDYHARGPALVAQYVGMLEAIGAQEQVRMLTETNPSRMLEGLSPLPVPLLRIKRTLWSRVTEAFR